MHLVDGTAPHRRRGPRCRRRHASPRRSRAILDDGRRDRRHRHPPVRALRRCAVTDWGRRRCATLWWRRGWTVAASKRRTRGRLRRGGHRAQGAGGARHDRDAHRGRGGRAAPAGGRPDARQGHPGRPVRHGGRLRGGEVPRGIIRSSTHRGRRRRGSAATPAYFALRAQRFMRTSGVTKQHLAAVVVKNRRHGVTIPTPCTGPRRGATLCSRASGVRAAASVDVVFPQRGSGRRGARGRRPETEPNRGRSRWPAAVLRSHVPGAVLSESTPLAGLTDDTLPTPSTLAATTPTRWRV